MSDDEKIQAGDATAAEGDNETNVAAAPDGAAEATATADNPFGVGNLDFEEAKKRRERALEAKRAKEAENPSYEMDGDVQVIKLSGSLFDDDPLPAPVTPRKTKSSGDAGRSPARGKPDRATTTGGGAGGINAAEMGLTAEEEAILLELQAQKERERNNIIQVGEKTLTKWPYDEYHLVQKEYWEHYFEREEQARLKRQQQADGDGHSDDSGSDVSSSDEDDEESESDSSGSSSEESSSSDSSRSETSSQRLDRKMAARRARKRAERRQRRKAEKKRLKRLNRDTEKEQEKRRKERQKVMEEERQSGLHDLKSDILVFERPQDPPDVKDAAADLPLTEFESVAKERAITMMSTWLFDAGLVQDLMQTKKVQDQDSEAQQAKKKEKKVEIKILPIGGKEKKNKEKQVDTGPKRTKMDIEIEKLEKHTRLQLDLINERLKKGVATSGSEVQGLVNSVVNTKMELVKLRQTSSMISNASDTVDGVAGVAAAQTTFAINKYPHLKYAINARRNLQKCFRELTFFSQIPENCARLTDELNTSEWTEEEWITLRNVCREHVQLEIFLVEAEAGMRKQQNDDEDDEDGEGTGRKNRRGSMNRTSFDVGLPHNNDEVDRFLKEHVQNVWELGDEIRMKILSGIAGAFELAFNDPAGMVALVEAVEIYESANREYQAVHGDEGRGVAKSLRFTDMRAVALGELYKDMEARGQEVFEELENSAEGAEDDAESENKIFTAILRGANELSAEISFVAEQMAPCFPSYWAVEIIWTACVAQLCANQILIHIGGPEGEKLPHLGMPQLLDLVAWVENFREIIEEAFPDIAGLDDRTYFDERPKLLAPDNRTVDVSKAKDTLAWYNNILWDAHKVAKIEFIFRTKEQAEQLLERFYKADHDKRQTSDGQLTTSLCGDIYGFIALQLKTLRERLTRKSEAMIQLVGVIFKALYDAQKQSRDHFLGDFECCCAGANDFVQMSEKAEDIIEEIRIECQLSVQAQETLFQQSAALLGLYNSDAVYAAQKISYFVFSDIYESEDITPLLFTVEWLDEMQDNEVASQIAITIEDYLGDIQEYLDNIMVLKALEALVVKSVIYYVEQLLTRASSHKSGRDSYFADNRRALERMEGDMALIKDLFEGFAEEEFPTLKRIIEREFEFFETVHETMSIAAGFSSDDIRDFIYAFQTRIQDYDVTFNIIGDLYHLVNPSEEKPLYAIVEEMKDDLKSLEEDKEESPEDDHATVPGLKLDAMLKKHIAEDKRSRPTGKGGWFG